MKNLIYATALLSTLFLVACSNTEQDPISPNADLFEKGIARELSQPFALYQKLSEVKPSSVNWKNYKQGITISVNSVSEVKTGRYHFATIEYVNNKGTVMAFLGESTVGTYYLDGFYANDISRLSVYYVDEGSTKEITVLPYEKNELFENLYIKGWVDGGSAVKIKSDQFPVNMQHIFAQLVTSEGNQLIFLGKPRSVGFDFPKSEKLSLKDIKLFTYTK